MYTKQKLPIALTPERRAALEHENAEIEIKVMVQAEDLARAKLTYEANTKDILKEKKNNLTKLRLGFEELEVNSFEYANEQEGTIQYMDEDGHVIHERVMTLEERRQYRVQFGRRQLTD